MFKKSGDRIIGELFDICGCTTYDDVIVAYHSLIVALNDDWRLMNRAGSTSMSASQPTMVSAMPVDAWLRETLFE